jgi:hypothetical protein
MPADLRKIRTFNQLVRYLEDELGWPLEGYDVEELTYDYEPDEIGLKPEEAAKVKAIRQLRPLAADQPWGIFFIEFDRKKLPIAVLRRILSHLVVKKRATAGRAERAAWHADDLLFISAFGNEQDDGREIGVAHFHQDAGDLPTLRVLGWDGADTTLKIEHVSRLLHERLHWREKGESIEEWRQRWTGAFRHKLGHVIQTADHLAEVLAALAKGIRDAAATLMEHETDKGPLTKLYRAFQANLIHDLTPESFADTYAQTITYGLLTAAISRTEMSEGRHGTALVAANVADMVPVTNPFLKEMLQTFLKAGGRKGAIDFDELGVQDVVELLRGEETDLPAILRDFGNKRSGEDPVIHFYEHFLGAYNKQLKVQRGVFYTPQPVVSYIVRSVHELLQTEFGLEHGLADTTTWGEMLKKYPEIKLPPLTDAADEKRTISPDEFFVQVLDPATGTATFLVETIDMIYRHLKDKWESGTGILPVIPGQHVQNARATFKTFDAFWNSYVPDALLPRLHGYELLMAPYAIAHMKIGLKLAETKYHFGSEERARIYLTNALDPWVKQLPLIGFDALAHEAAEVNEVKRNKRFTVVIGNPPYSGHSANKGQWIEGLVGDYFQVNGVPLNEANSKWLRDDYVKFIRLGQEVMRRSKVGLFSFITNHGYIDNPTFRGLRFCLLADFCRLWITDLHGNMKKKERDDSGEHDENVFDIQQGVAVIAGLFGRTTTAHVRHGHLRGNRSAKYARLTTGSSRTLASTPTQPSQPFHLFMPQDISTRSEYETFISVTQEARECSLGILTKRDSLVVAFNPDELLSVLRRFADGSRTDKEIAEEFGVPLADKDRWNIATARAALNRVYERNVCPVLYRPFDVRFVYYEDTVVARTNRRVFRNLELVEGNRAIILGRQGMATGSEQWDVCFVCDGLADQNIYRRGGGTVIPLYLAEDDQGLGLGDSQLNFSTSYFRNRKATPEDNFNYIYAVFHSPGYRARYAEFLKIDFPRVPLTENFELFRALAKLGGELVVLHLLESNNLNKPITEFIGQGRDVVKVGYTEGTVWIDAAGSKAATTAGTSGFRGVPEDVWNFHIGGYQVCEKWLKDRKGRTLTKDNIAHYHKIVIALSETIRLMAEIDQVINQYGGWPGAFSTTATSAPATATEPDPPAVSVEAAKPAARAKPAPAQDLLLDVEGELPMNRDTPQEFSDIYEMCLVREWFEKNGPSDREEAAKGLIYSLGYGRAGSRLMEQADNVLRTAVRRGVLRNDGGTLSLLERSIEGYDREFLKTQFLAAVGQTWISRDKAIMDFARWLGFKRTGSVIEETARSLINGLLREGRLESDASDEIRRMS